MADMTPEQRRAMALAQARLRLSQQQPERVEATSGSAEPEVVSEGGIMRGPGVDVSGTQSAPEMMQRRYGGSYDTMTGEPLPSDLLPAGVRPGDYRSTEPMQMRQEVDQRPVSIYGYAPEGSARSEMAEGLRSSSNRDVFEFGRNMLADAIDNPAQALEDYTPIGDVKGAMGNIAEAGGSIREGDIAGAALNYAEAGRDAGFAALDVVGGRAATTPLRRAYTAPSEQIARAAVPQPQSSLRGVLQTTVTPPLDNRAIRDLERYLRRGGVEVNDVTFRNIRDLVQNGGEALNSGGSLPTRIGDVLGDATGRPEQTQRLVQNLLRTAGSTGQAGEDVVRNIVREDIPAARQYAQQRIRSIMGDRPIADARREIKQELSRIGREGYEPILREGPQSVDAENAILDVILGPGMSELMTPFRKMAAGRGMTVDDFIQSNPMAAAHWMQSQANKLAKRSSDAADRYAYRDLRERLLDVLEDAHDGYRGVRMEFGDEFGAEEALDFGRNGFWSKLQMPGDRDILREDFEALSEAQQEVALASARDTILQRVSAGMADSVPRGSRILDENVSDGIQEVFGEKGRQLINDVQQAYEFALRRRQLDPAYGSRTEPLAQAIQTTRDNVSGGLRTSMAGGLRALGNINVLQPMQGSTNAMARFIEPNPDAKINRMAELLATPVRPPRNALQDMIPE